MGPVQWRRTSVLDAGTHPRAGPPVWLARSWSSRLVGVLGRQSVLRSGGCWLLPCRSVHGIGLRAPLDCVFLDAEDRVVAVRRLRPGFALLMPGAHSVVELAEGQAARHGLRPGARLCLRPVPSTD